LRRSLWVTQVFAVVALGSGSPLPDIGLPVDGLTAVTLRDTFAEVHFGHPHEAIDLPAPKGTPVRAVLAGTIRKLFLSKPGGNTIYEFDDKAVDCYYYAHLDRYADGLREGLRVEQGDIIGFVGSTGDADPKSPHLHFAVFELGPEKQWWKGKPLDPYPALLAALKRGK
jgi:murein DD-endopeptidase MepM/ murein hydrolase activator NlpD